MDDKLPLVQRSKIYVHIYMYMLRTYLLEIHKKLKPVIIFGEEDWSSTGEKLFT